MVNLMVSIGELTYSFISVKLGIIILPSRLLRAEFDYLAGCFLGFLFCLCLGGKSSATVAQQLSILRP